MIVETPAAPPRLRLGRRQRNDLAMLAGQRTVAQNMTRAGPAWVVVRTGARIARRRMARLIELRLVEMRRDAGHWREWRLTDAGERAALLPPPSPRKRKVRESKED